MTLPDIHYSASQIETHDDCARKWFMRSVEKLEQPVNKYAEAGSQVHEVLEQYLRSGKLPQPGELNYKWLKTISSGVKFLPQPGREDLIIEEKFSMELPGLGEMVGFKDLLFQDKTSARGRWLWTNVDHKSTGNLKWAKTAEELRTNTQSVIYAVDTMVRMDVDMVRNRWIYYHRHETKPQPARMVEVVLTEAALQEPWNQILDSCKSMKTIRESGCTRSDVPFNLEACEKYGGCPYKKECGLSPAQRLKGLRKAMGLADKVAARKAAQAMTEPSRTPSGVPNKTNPPRQDTGPVNPPESAKSEPANPKAAAPAPATLPSTGGLEVSFTLNDAAVAALASAIVARMK